MAATESLAYQEVPEPRLQRKVLQNWSHTDLYVLTILILVFIATGTWLYKLNMAAFSLLAVAFEIVLLLPLLWRERKGFGRIYEEMWSSGRGSFNQKYLDGYLWKAEDTDRTIIRWLRNRDGKRPAVPFSMSEIRGIVAGKERRAALLHNSNGYDHLYLVGSGGAFSMLDVTRQHLATNRLADQLNMTISKSDLKCGISFVKVKGPDEGNTFAAYLRRNSDPVAAKPELFELDEGQRQFAEWLNGNAAQLRPTAAHHGAAKPWYVLAITIKRPSLLKSKKRGGEVNEEDLYNLPIIELGASLVNALKADSILGMSDVHCMGLAELAAFIRCSWDVVGINDYFKQIGAGQIPQTDSEIDQIRATYGDDEVGARLQAWPSEQIRTQPSGKCIQFDENFIGVLRVTSLPSQVRADQFMGIHYLEPVGLWARIALVGQSISGETETRQAVIAESAVINFQQAFFRNRVVQNPKWKRREAKLHDQAMSYSAYSISQHFNMLVTIVDGTERQVLEKMAHMQAALSGRGFSSSVVDDSDRLLNAALTGCLAANRL